MIFWYLHVTYCGLFCKLKHVKKPLNEFFEFAQNFSDKMKSLNCKILLCFSNSNLLFDVDTVLQNPTLKKTLFARLNEKQLY